MDNLFAYLTKFRLFSSNPKYYGKTQYRAALVIFTKSTFWPFQRNFDFLFDKSSETRACDQLSLFDDNTIKRRSLNMKSFRALINVQL